MRYVPYAAYRSVDLYSQCLSSPASDTSTNDLDEINLPGNKVTRTAGHLDPTPFLLHRGVVAHLSKIVVTIQCVCGGVC